ncbi:ribonucleoside-triphosphate reductase [Candidatus Campbellbacteria bacterium CG22_combo_CG10-13_8_21_14_all_36_13]|uniref:Ribonucleoside-triphosphate reductase n=1 Tax=Candidatus Campbellbacteria bacterium CG22_combo_CG10-13_8_21_14_all_36_13 TaxID=1974529 RepID=A0A2H0DY25_9BACT|nr:MAG: ribonucleoside-triphosphate reductase [Candidatus Campbellbacteria bacterium CG22_combo_CG10-13_8_21_14_all_36_13]
MPKTAQKSPKNTKKGKKKIENSFVKRILKRDGSIVPFDLSKVTNATYKAMNAAEEGSIEEAELVANRVLSDLVRISKRFKNFVPSVEGIQDAVEKELILGNYVKAAKAFILYRNERAKVRGNELRVKPEVVQKIEEASKYFKTPYQEFIFYQFYSRWRDDLGRRETWIESIDRFMDFMKENLGNKFSAKEYDEVREGILKQEVCPSMRLLWSAGKACRATNVCAYNCAYIAPTRWKDLADIMYVSMCGAGCGYSVEPENVEQFPQIQKQTGEKAPTIVVEDSKEGWCDAFVGACEAWSSGKDVEIDYSKIRPAGDRLLTMGGRASGPAPLQELMKFTKKKMLTKQGRRLSTLDMHDIICQIGLIVVAGGVRRSALISLSALDDVDLRDAKKGAFWQTNGQRSMANNSAVYEAKPTATEFLEEWSALVSSGSGERGIYNRGGLEKQLPARRWENLKYEKQPGMNPCGEIYLKSRQFCNLTSIVIRPEDTEKSLKRKMRLATMLGTYQASLTDFKYISKDWKKNCDEEALLGVSLTGYFDNKIVRDDKVLESLRNEALIVNRKYAKKIGINVSTAVTCVKPHGNSGQLLGVGSGMHPWYAPYFIRRVRISVNDPLLKLAREQGVPIHPEVGYSTSNATTMVLEFPIKAPKGAVFKDQVSAIDFLNEWKRLKVHFTEHNPSATVYVGPDEWLAVANFVYENWDIVGGLSFLPRNEHVYQLAPYEEITKEEFERRSAELSKLDFSKLVIYELDDQTIGAKELACVGGACEI